MNESAQQSLLESWLRLHKSLLFKVVRSFAFSRADQEDLFQEIIIQLWHSIPSFQHQSKITTWIYRVALNTAISWSRKEAKYQEKKQVNVEDKILQDNVNNSADERLIWLYEEITKLNKIDRSLILLLLDGFNYKEMADILGISESNVGVKINRIKKHLIQQSTTYEHHGI